MTGNEWYNIPAEVSLIKTLDQLFKPDRLVTRDIERTHFKSNLISLYFVRELSLREAALGALLGRILTFSSAEYPNLKAISDQEDDLYGVVVYFDLDKYRDQLVLEYKMIYPKYQLLPIEKDLTDQAIEFYHSLLTRPLLVDGLFDQEIFQMEKDNLMEELASIQKDPEAYTYRQCNQAHFASSNLGIYKYSDIATVRQISNQELVAYYHDLFDSLVFRYRHGDFLHHSGGVGLRPASLPKLDKLMQKTHLEEERKLNQSVLVQAYQTDIEHTQPDSQAAMLFSAILGSYSNSVLFRTIREQLGYCYSIFTKYDKYRNVMFISVAYQESNHEALVSKIDQLVKQIQAGQIDEDDFAVAKLETIQGLKSLADRQETMLDYEFIQDLFGKTDSIEDRVRQLEQLTLTDITRAAGSFELMTSYHLKGTR